jgi:hypothetical protein
MPIRWAGQPEPVPILFSIGNQHVSIADPTRFSLNPRVDVYPGEGEALNIAAKFDSEVECYGWSNENYFSNPIWRHPNWKLSSGRYLVRVTVLSAGQNCTGVFRLIADVPRGNFRLEDARPEDRVYG